MQEVWLTDEELNLVYQWGAERARIMANVPDKKGSPKKGQLHSPVQADALGIAAEVAGCKLLGVDYLNRDFYIPVAELVGGRLPAVCREVPDVLGKYEIRRVERHNYPINMFPKDRKAGAYVLQAIVEHVHLDNGMIRRPSGLVTFTAWQDAAEDWKHAKYDGGSYHCTYPRRRPMTSLPLPKVVV